MNIQLIYVFKNHQGAANLEDNQFSSKLQNQHQTKAACTLHYPTLKVKYMKKILI